MWLPIPWQIGTLSVKDFLQYVVHDSKERVKIRHPNGHVVYLDAIRFKEPLERAATSRNEWCAFQWVQTGFVTGWKDEAVEWEKWNANPQKKPE